MAAAETSGKGQAWRLRQSFAPLFLCEYCMNSEAACVVRDKGQFSNHHEGIPQEGEAELKAGPSTGVKYGVFGDVDDSKREHTKKKRIEVTEMYGWQTLQFTEDVRDGRGMSIPPTLKAFFPKSLNSFSKQCEIYLQATLAHDTLD